MPDAGTRLAHHEGCRYEEARTEGPTGATPRQRAGEAARDLCGSARSGSRLRIGSRGRGCPARLRAGSPYRAGIRGIEQEHRRADRADARPRYAEPVFPVVGGARGRALQYRDHLRQGLVSLGCRDPGRQPAARRQLDQRRLPRGRPDNRYVPGPAFPQTRQPRDRPGRASAFQSGPAAAALRGSGRAGVDRQSTSGGVHVVRYNTALPA